MEHATPDTITNYTTHLTTFNQSQNITSWQSTHVPMTSWTNSTDFQTTAVPSQGEIPEYWGFIAAGIAILFYGSNFVPVKQYETGDGMFFQWIMCSGAMLAGIVVQLIRNQPPFFPMAMIGGVVWEIGNICVVPIVKTVGLGLGLCIWSMVNLLSGWSTGRFGFFGVTKAVPNNKAMNYAGVALCVASAVVFSLIKNDVTPAETENEPLVSAEISPQTYGSKGNESPYQSKNDKHKTINMDGQSDEKSFIDRLSPGMQRIVGLVLCIFSGAMYGQMFTGATYVQDHPELYPGATLNGLDYVFADFCGLYITSTVFFVIYIIFMKNKPKIYPKVILPGLISGVMWSVGTSCWFVANRSLSIPVAFPIVTTGPSIVASLWGVIVFKEIQGTRNLLILFLGFGIAITGAILAGVSRH
ncbi:transmembrane protein 144-like isoform X1 [Mytilus californianus]|uniref:transmembrane protein 144-like isoform X1 n=1 Tax=Mytilus californianus TaxID=6549 RepID=UPI00224734A9|nr:transmembrane protein 144-like isoform X1 [Mytilus californianus]